LVNSNFGELSEDEKNGQLHWYRKTLIEYENDPSIDFVIVGCHHPPFTNSKIVGGSREVRDYYLPEYYRSKKCKLFLSGHAHAYEHFRINGKDFLVIGGGSGLQHPLRIGENAEYQDIFSNSRGKRMFHFLTIKTCDDTLTVELKMLRPDFEGFESIPQLIFIGDRSTERRSRE
jgi:3',5'-cyclic AMP phosphodiesterase CpdA